MTRDDQVLALLGDANPVPDADEFVAALSAPLDVPDSWSGEMTDTFVREIELEKEQRVKPWIGAVAAGVAVFVAVAAFALWSGGDPDVASSPEVGVVEDFYNAFSDGDVDRMDELSAEGFERDRNFEQVLINLGNKFELSNCATAGPGRAGGTVVACDVNQVSDWEGPAGIELAYSLTAVVSSDLLLVDGESSQPDLEDAFQFNFRFWVWMRNAHQDVYRTIPPWDNQSLPGWRTDPADALVAIEYVDEFIAQSDDYPLDSGG